MIIKSVFLRSVDPPNYFVDISKSLVFQEFLNAVNDFYCGIRIDE